MNRFGLLVAVMASLLLISGCENSKETKLFKAQICLDTANVGTEAAACVQPILSETSKRAYVLICSARFLERGLDETKIVQALKEISDDEGTDPTSTAIANLAVMNSVTNPTSYDVTFARESYNSSCSLTESKGLIALSSFSVIATSIGALTGATGCIDTSPSSGEPYEIDVACMKTEIAGGTTGDTTILGETARENQETLCGENGVFKDEEICTDINASVTAGGTDQAIGDAIMAAIQGD